MRKKNAQEYSAAEFDAVVAMIQRDTALREDIEAITGQKLDGKTPRQIFDLFRAINQAADVQTMVNRYGQARQALRQTRAQLAEPVEVEPTAAAHITRLETRLDEQKKELARLKETNKALMSGQVAPIAGRVIKGEVAS